MKKDPRRHGGESDLLGTLLMIVLILTLVVITAR
jgi:hypothetical protein